MKQFILDLIAHIKTLVDIQYVHVWNNHLQLLYNEDGSKTNLFQMPAVFVEPQPSTIMQLGEGIQMYDPLDINVHLLHWQLDSGDGNFEQNLDVFDLKNKLFQILQKFHPGSVSDPANSFIRIKEEHDYNHKGVYHFIMTFRTTLVDSIMQEPVGGSDWDPIPMPLEISQTTKGSTDGTEPHLYEFTPAP